MNNKTTLASALLAADPKLSEIVGGSTDRILEALPDIQAMARVAVRSRPTTKPSRLAAGNIEKAAPCA